MPNFWEDHESPVVLLGKAGKPLVGSSSSGQRIRQAAGYTIVILFVAGLMVAALHAAILGHGLIASIEKGLKAVDGENGSWKFVELVSLLFAALLTVYWNIDSRFGRLWSYAATTFNEATKAESYLTRRYLLACLALDLIDMRLWAHETFTEFFKRELGHALGWLESVDRGRSSRIRAKVEEGFATKAEVVAVVYEYVQYVRKVDEGDLIQSRSTTNVASANTASSLAKVISQ